MGPESNRAPARRSAVWDQIPPSTVAALLRLAGRSLDGAHSGGPDSPDRPGEPSGTGPSPSRATEPGNTGVSQPGEAGEAGAGQPAKVSGTGPGPSRATEPSGTEPSPTGDRDSPPERQPRAVAPSWPQVIGTTVRLWVRRHQRTPRTPSTSSAEWVRTGQRQTASWRPLMVGLIVLAVAIVVASGLIVALPRHPATTAPSASQAGAPSGQGAGALGGIANVRRETAAWVIGQVSRSAIVACDPVMCAALQAQGLAAQNMISLQPTTSDPLGSDVVVATAAVRSQFGSRLASVFAPTVIASFGSGVARIDVRAVAPDGTAAYEAALRSDRLSRLAAGAQLLGNRQIIAAPTAGRELASGQVDSRLLIMLAALAARYPLKIVAFGTPAPGTGPDVPLRSVDVTATGKNGAAEVAPILAFLQAQLPPYRPLRTRVLRQGGGRAVLHIDFGAPSPLGLLGTRMTP